MLPVHLFYPGINILVLICHQVRVALHLFFLLLGYLYLVFFVIPCIGRGRKFSLGGLSINIACKAYTKNFQPRPLNRSLKFIHGQEVKKRCKKGYQIGTTIRYLAYSSKLFIKSYYGTQILGGLQPQSPILPPMPWCFSVPKMDSGI